jgi:hypothetical protein
MTGGATWRLRNKLVHGTHTQRYITSTALLTSWLNYSSLADVRTTCIKVPYLIGKIFLCNFFNYKQLIYKDIQAINLVL